MVDDELGDEKLPFLFVEDKKRSNNFRGFQFVAHGQAKNMKPVARFYELPRMNHDPYQINHQRHDYPLVNVYKKTMWNITTFNG